MTIPLAGSPTGWWLGIGGASWRTPMNELVASVPIVHGRRHRRWRSRGFGIVHGDLHVLRGVDLTVAEHESSGLIGSSGCGNRPCCAASTCWNHRCRPHPGQGQEITASGVDVNRMRRPHGKSCSSRSTVPHMSVLHNVTLAPRRPPGSPKARAEADATSCSNGSALPTSATSTPTAFSGGQQQRVAIVRALAYGAGPAAAR